ncbi:MAG: PQQ-binding-like beta-propeller repeat protein [Planctomycetota bacterium]|nr:PQQ-binding-like beta-propeller repeat protein [Planctomycetota bacterium]
MLCPYLRGGAQPIKWCILALCSLNISPLSSWAQDGATTFPERSWPQFLGPMRNGHSPEGGLNLDWSTRPPRTKWIAEPGAGYTSIAVIHQRVFIGAQRGDSDFVVCYNRTTGREEWAYVIGRGYQDVQQQGPGPRATPTIDGDRLYGLGPAGHLFCLTAADGREVWKVNVFKETGAKDPAGENLYWGMSGSPLVVGNLVICQPGGDRDNSVAAFDKETGDVVWKAASDYRSYASPLSVSLAGRQQLLCYAGDALLSMQPSTGQILWRYAHENQYKCNCATPVVLGNRVLVSTAYGGGSALLNITTADKRWSVHERWNSRRLQSLFTTPIVIDNLIFGCHGDLGVCTLRCLDLATGKLVWTAREPGRCTMIAVDGHLICLSEDGTLRVVKATREGYLERGKIDGLLRAKSWATPALAGGHLFARDQQRLVCLDLQRK